ncbi:glycosyltransferase [Pseudophaeobacter sp.]|uniref:glycosyltransferase n=1 Tax=Pseudophaeobacter sp. TaxID=1971739 RepID=UPI004059193D
MKILYYNWADYLDSQNRGGGVTVYQRNLMEETGNQAEIEPVFLSSGLGHDLSGRPPRWEAVRHGARLDRDRRYEIVNSAVLAPAHHAFGSLAQLYHAPTEAAFFDFLDKTGPYDVVHFNNLEGLPAGVLRLKERFPETRVILSLHNYYPFCPQVNLWRDERATCTDNEGGAACATCLPHNHNQRALRLADALSYRLRVAGLEPGRPGYDLTYRWLWRIGGRSARALGWAKRRLAGQKQAQIRPDTSHFATRRQAMVDLINSQCDAVLCVSDAVREIALTHGVSAEIARTSYIGTRAAEEFHRTAPRPFPRSDGQFTLAYLGYMRRDKGFYFLLDALEALPDVMLARLRLVLASRQGDAATMRRIKALGARLAALEYHDGYKHDDLDRLLDGVDIGLIPVLWHDNLPQVAIEMHARHIPLLTADMGGAQELGRAPQMVFPAGDVSALQARLKTLLAEGFDVNAYWARAMVPVGMGSHLEELVTIYRGR